MTGDLVTTNPEPTVDVACPSRIGWELWRRPPPNPFPLEGQAPERVLPAPPNLALITQQHGGRTVPGTVLLVVGVVLLLAGFGPLADSGVSLPMQIVGVIAGVGGYALLTEGSTAVRQANRRYSQALVSFEETFRIAEGDWRSQRDRWYAEEARRIEAIPLYYPLHQVDHTRRLDVFGGPIAGWACLINTLARPLVDHGVGVSVLDFTEASVGVELCMYAAAAEAGFRYRVLPADLPGVDLLLGLDASQVAEVLVSSSHAVRDRSGREDEEHWEVDTAIVAEVCRHLASGGLTVRRIVDGLDVVNQAGTSGSSSSLSPAERTALEDSAYLAATASRVRERYSYLRPRLEVLAAMAEEGATDVAALPGHGEVSVLAVQDSGPRELSLLANLTTQCVLQRVSVQRASGAHPLVVVAGADLLSFETVSALSQRASRAGARTVFLYRNLENDARRLLGTDGSETIFFQLQSHEQAQYAADFIGRRHRFVVGQITKSVADSLGGSHGQNRSWSTGTSETVGRSASYRGLARILTETSRSSSKDQSVTDESGTQWSTTWQRTETYGETATRVYEYDTEPRTIQELDVSSFIFVSRVGGRTRVAAGDCNPGLERLPYTADHPRELPSG